MQGMKQRQTRNTTDRRTKGQKLNYAMFTEDPQLQDYLYDLRNMSHINSLYGRKFIC